SDEPGADARAERQVALVEEWFEPTRYDVRDGAPKAVVVAVTTRVRDWLRLRLASGGLVDGIAVEQCRQLREILESAPRNTRDVGWCWCYPRPTGASTCHLTRSGTKWSPASGSTNGRSDGSPSRSPISSPYPGMTLRSKSWRHSPCRRRDRPGRCMPESSAPR